MYSTCDHAGCGRPSWSFVHFPNHPSNRGNEKITHNFFKVADQ